MIEFDRLAALADDVTLSCISTAQGVRSHLSARTEVLALRRALEEGAATFEDVEAFVREVIAQFIRGTLSSSDTVIAAVVVAIEPLPLATFEEFIEDLARVKIAEMPMSPRVARLSLRERSMRFAQLTNREFTIADANEQAWPPREDRPIRIEIGDDYRTLDLQQVA